MSVLGKKRKLAIPEDEDEDAEHLKKRKKSQETENPNWNKGKMYAFKSLKNRRITGKTNKFKAPKKRNGFKAPKMLKKPIMNQVNKKKQNKIQHQSISDAEDEAMDMDLKNKNNDSTEYEESDCEENQNENKNKRKESEADDNKNENEQNDDENKENHNINSNKKIQSEPDENENDEIKQVQSDTNDDEESDKSEFESDENDNEPSKKSKQEHRNNYCGLNGYKLKYFCYLSEPIKIGYEKPSKLFSLNSISKTFKIIIDSITFSSNFQEMRQFDYVQIFDNKNETEMDNKWELFRNSFMNHLCKICLKNGIWNDLVLIFKLFETVWNKKHENKKEKYLTFRWPINEQFEDDLLDEMKQIKPEIIINLLSEMYGEKHKNNCNETKLFDLFYETYLLQNDDEIYSGPGFGRCLYLYLNANTFLDIDDETGHKYEGDDEQQLNEALAIANKGKSANIISMVDNIDNRFEARNKYLFAINSMLQNKEIRININKSLIDCESGRNENFLAIYRNIELAIKCFDKFQPKNNGNVYILCHSKINGKKMKIFPDLNKKKEVKKFFVNGRNMYKNYGYLNYGYVELATFDDIKSYFINKTIKAKNKQFVILKLNLNKYNFDNWNCWTIVDNNNNYDNNTHKIYRSMLGICCIVPVKQLKEIKIQTNVNKKKVSKVKMYQCDVISHQQFFKHIFDFE